MSCCINLSSSGVTSNCSSAASAAANAAQAQIRITDHGPAAIAERRCYTDGRFFRTRPIGLPINRDVFRPAIAADYPAKLPAKKNSPHTDTPTDRTPVVLASRAYERVLYLRE